MKSGAEKFGDRGEGDQHPQMSPSPFCWPTTDLNKLQCLALELGYLN